MTLTEHELLALQEPPKPLSFEPPWQIFGVSRSQLSIARHYGGITYSGHGYTYDPTDDSLTRNDVLRAVMKMRRVRKSPAVDRTDQLSLPVGDDA